MTKFKVGDKVRITEDLYPRLIGKVGQIIEDDGSTIPYLVVLENGEECWKRAKNIKLLKDSPSTHNENLVLTRLFHAEAEVDKMSRSIDELKRRIETLEADKPKSSRNFTFHNIAGKPEYAIRTPKTPNQRRAIVIKRAEAYVEDLRKRAIDFDNNLDGNSIFNHKRTKLEFHVNAEKGVVTALAKLNGSSNIIGKTFARCAPGDVFNDKIGMAIAAGRLYGIDIPKEFTDAPQPTEVVKGHIVNGRNKVFAIKPKRRTYGRGAGRQFAGHEYGYTYISENDYEVWAFLDNANITDDSEAEYE